MFGYLTKTSRIVSIDPQPNFRGRVLVCASIWLAVQVLIHVARSYAISGFRDLRGVSLEPSSTSRPGKPFTQTSRVTIFVPRRVHDVTLTTATTSTYIKGIDRHSVYLSPSPPTTLHDCDETRVGLPRSQRDILASGQQPILSVMIEFGCSDLAAHPPFTRLGRPFAIAFLSLFRRRMINLERV